MKIIFLMPMGTVEWLVPADRQEGFNFSAFVTNIRAQGFFMAPDVYLRHDAMIGILPGPEGLKTFTPSFPQTQGSA